MNLRSLYEQGQRVGLF